MRTSWVDSVASLLTALSLLMACVVGILLFLWFFQDKPDMTTGFIPPPEFSTAGDQGAKSADFQIPESEEVVVLQDIPIESMLGNLTQVASEIADETNPAFGSGSIGMVGPSDRLIGENESDLVPRFNRWQIDFTAKSIQDYALQLDFFDIEIGAIGGEIQGVDIARELSSSVKVYRIVDTENEKRLYFMWNSPSPLMLYDRQLLAKGGVSLKDRLTLKFIPVKLENDLALLEIEYAKSRGVQEVSKIAKTVFECKGVASDFRFEVVAQRYRK